MKLTIVIKDKKTVVEDVSPNETVSDLKAMLFNLDLTITLDFALLYDGQVLEEESKLSEVGVGEGASLVVQFSTSTDFLESFAVGSMIADVGVGTNTTGSNVDEPESLVDGLFGKGHYTALQAANEELSLASMKCFGPESVEKKEIFLINLWMFSPSFQEGFQPPEGNLDNPWTIPIGVSIDIRLEVDKERFQIEGNSTETVPWDGYPTNVSFELKCLPEAQEGPTNVVVRLTYEGTDLGIFMAEIWVGKPPDNSKRPQRGATDLSASTKSGGGGGKKGMLRRGGGGGGGKPKLDDMDAEERRLSLELAQLMEEAEADITDTISAVEGNVLPSQVTVFPVRGPPHIFLAASGQFTDAFHAVENGLREYGYDIYIGNNDLLLKSAGVYIPCFLADSNDQKQALEQQISKALKFDPIVVPIYVGKVQEHAALKGRQCVKVASVDESTSFAVHKLIQTHVAGQVVGLKI